MTVALVIVLVFGITQAGGWDAVMANAQSLKGYLSMFNIHDVATGEATPYNAIKIISTLAWGLGYFGMPHILLRFMAIESPAKIKLSRRVASIWVVISMGIGIVIGVVGLGMVANNALSPLDDSETIVIQIANLLSQNGVGLALVAGIIISGILACTMSTSDSQLLAASSSVSENIIGGLFKIKLGEKAEMIVARLVLIVISVIAVVLAWDSNSSVFGIVSFAWAGFGAAFGPVVLLSLFWKRSNKYGAIAGMISGGAMVFIWKYAIAGLAPVLNIYELLPAFITGLLVNVIVSLVTPKPEKEILDTFEEVKKLK
jgi:sodium/proline symporter